MRNSSVVRTAFKTMKHKRLAWSAAVIVGLILVQVVHAPLLPVLAGCTLALGLVLLRSWPAAPKAKEASVRGGR